MNSYKQTVFIDDMLPSGVNPREDFGDMDKLVRSIEATGGQPVNPIIVVSDADKYRIIDGERRWRALKQMGIKQTDVLVFSSYSGAQEAVAMCATDDKQLLSEKERAKGLQLLLDGMVDAETGAKALGVDEESFKRAKRARRSRKDIGQLTLETLIIAGDEEFSDDERAAILEDADLYEGAAAQRAASIRERHKKEAKLKALRDAMPEGIEFRETGAPYFPERQGLIYIGAIKTAKAAREVEARPDLVCYQANVGVYWELYEKVADGPIESSETIKKAENERKADEWQAKAESVLKNCSDYLLGMIDDAIVEPKALRKRIRENFPKDWLEDHEIAPDLISHAEKAHLSMSEVVDYLSFIWRTDLFRSWNGTVNEYALENFREVVDIAKADGWEPLGEDFEFLTLLDGEVK